MPETFLTPALAAEYPTLNTIINNLQTTAAGYGETSTFNQLVTAINLSPSFAGFLNQQATTQTTIQGQSVPELSAIVP